MGNKREKHVDMEKSSESNILSKINPSMCCDIRNTYVYVYIYVCVCVCAIWCVKYVLLCFLYYCVPFRCPKMIFKVDHIYLAVHRLQAVNGKTLVVGK